ncbi:MAG TPA: MMPL family transporter, partial [Acidimicrobiales bacterium]|nr:MMPL family transporter [Acidimicrobiales bacterium]
MNRFFSGLGKVVVRFRWLVVIVWVVGTIAAVRSLPSLSSQVDNNNGAFLPASAPSNQAAVLAEPLIGSQNHSQIPIVASTSGPHLNAGDQAAIQDILQRLDRVPSRITAHYLGISPDGRAAQLLFVSSVSPFGQSGAKQLVDDLNAAIASVPVPADLQVHLAGQIATDVANQEQSSKQGKQIQDASILFIIILLFIIFRAVLAPLVTLLPAALVLALSGSFIGALGSAGFLKVSFFTQILLIVLILGAGTDYGLFLVFRVREQLYAGSDPKDAVVYAVRRVGESIT